MTDLLDLLDSKGCLVADGAMGTQLFASGLTAGRPPESCNTDDPDKVRSIHHAFVEAGADIILTNTFGGTRPRLALHGLQDRVGALNEAGARLTLEIAAGANRPVVVAGSLGPTGEIVGGSSMSAQDCEAAFAEQAQGLVAGGVDCMWIETMSDLAEVESAVRGVRSVTDLPIAVTMSFDTDGATGQGTTPAGFASRVHDLDVSAVGANCGHALAETEDAVRALVAAVPRPVISKANAGIPRWDGHTLAYDGTPEVMAEHARRVRAAGARIIGGCCGSTPAHLRRIVEALNQA